MSRTTTSPFRALAAVALSMTVTLAACGGSDPAVDSAAAVSDRAPETPATTAAPEPQPEVDSPPTTVASPSTTVPRRITPTTASPATAPATSPPSDAALATTAAPAPKYAPGQRISPSSAEVQTAIATLSTRIPMFKPNESQLRTFADAACTSFDQGQTKDQVENTVRQAVTYVQGASLSPADAEFAVRTVVQLRCPGYLS
ncbi:MAG: hypothetical protein ACLGI2_05510 [Acidimicrobiia bacterium]